MIIDEKLSKAGKVSIFEHIYNHINPSGPGLLPGGELLPDDEMIGINEDIHWAPGAMDVMGAKPDAAEAGEVENLAESFVSSFHEVSKNPNEETIEKLEEKLSYPDTLAVIDTVLRKLVVDTKLNQSIIYRVCRTIMLNSNNRGAVKFAIGVTGLYGQKQDINIFKIFARHDEFSLYCAVAVLGDLNETTDIWLDMAKNVTGWGRIHIVNRLCDVRRKDIRDFLLEEGYYNDILPDYSACKIAQSVNLADFLRSSSIDAHKFEGAGSILSSMVSASLNPGPFDGIDKYRDAESAVLRYLKHCRTMAKSLHHIRSIHTVSRLAMPENQGGCLEKVRFKKEAVETIWKSCNELLMPGRWQKAILASLRSDDPEDQWESIAAANTVGLDITDSVYSVLSGDPARPPLWYYLIQTADETGIDKVLDLAERKLLVSDSYYINSKTLQCLNFFMQDLERFPGKGWNLIKHIIENGGASLKNLALKLLFTWSSAMTGSEQTNLIRKLQQDEDDMVRLSADYLLKRWS